MYLPDLMSIHRTELYMWSRLYTHLIATVHSVLQADNIILTISPHAHDAYYGGATRTTVEQRLPYPQQM